MNSNCYISKTAKLGKNVELGSNVYIGDNVEIGDNCVIMQGAYIGKNTKIGSGTRIFPYAIIGVEPQDLKYKGEESFVEIGENNVIREFVTIHLATGEGEKTIIGNNNLLMGYVHIAHNCVLGSNIIMSNAAMLAGHVIVNDFAVIGGMVGVHQFRKIGSYSMIGGKAKVNVDVPPYMLVDRTPLAIMGLNVIGLKRKGFTSEDIKVCKEILKIYTSEEKLEEALNKIKELGKWGEKFVEFFDENVKYPLRRVGS